MSDKSGLVKFADDIIKKIKSDFPNQTEKALEILNKELQKTDYLNNNRYIRCIIFLANKELNELANFVERARIDPRDVMLWAEYIDRESDNCKRVRDFNKSFEENDLSIRDDLK